MDEHLVEVLNLLGVTLGLYGYVVIGDGGQHWVPFQDRTDNPQGFHLNAITSTGDALYIAGEQGLLLKWDDQVQRFAAAHLADYHTVGAQAQSGAHQVGHGHHAGLGTQGDVIMAEMRGESALQRLWRPVTALLFVFIGLLFAAGMPFHDAESLSVMIGFLVFLVVFLWAFAARSLRRVWAVLAGFGLLMAGTASLVQHLLI